MDTANTIDETKLGPSTGADGMIALAMNRDGGTPENPEGAKIVVPQGRAFRPDNGHAQARPGSRIT